MDFCITLPASILTHEKIPLVHFSLSWLGVFLFAMSQIITIQLIVFGFKYLEAQIGTLILPLEVIFGIIIGFIFFKEALSVQIVIGGVFIIIATFLPNLFVNHQPLVEIK